MRLCEALASYDASRHTAVHHHLPHPYTYPRENCLKRANGGGRVTGQASSAFFPRTVYCIGYLIAPPYSRTRSEVKQSIDCWCLPFFWFAFSLLLGSLLCFLPFACSIVITMRNPIGSTYLSFVYSSLVFFFFLYVQYSRSESLPFSFFPFEKCVLCFKGYRGALLLCVLSLPSLCEGLSFLWCSPW